MHTTASAEDAAKLIHVHCDMIKRDIEHHKVLMGLKIDPFRTVFYGTCEGCIDTKRISKI